MRSANKLLFVCFVYFVVLDPPTISYNSPLATAHLLNKTTLSTRQTTSWKSSLVEYSQPMR